MTDNMFTLVSLSSIGFLGLVTLLHASKVTRDSRYRTPTLPLLALALVAGSATIFLCQDLLHVFVVLKTITCVKAVLISSATHKNAPIAAYKYIVMAVLGGFMQLYGLSIVSSYAGSTTFHHVQQVSVGGQDHGFLHLAGVLVTIGFATEMGIFPFHWWLPDMYATVSSPVLAILNIKAMACAGMFVRVVHVLHPAIPSIGTICMVLGIVSIVVGSLLAFQERRVFVALAFVTVFEQGCVLLVSSSISAGAIPVSAFYLVNGTFMKVALVMVSGLASRAGAPCREGKGRALLAGAFFVSLLSLSGTPPFSGFFAKWLFLQEVSSNVMVTAGMIATVAIVGMVVVCSFVVLVGLLVSYHATFHVAPEPGIATVPPPRLALAAPLVLVTFTVLLGLFPPFIEMLFFAG